MVPYVCSILTNDGSSSCKTRLIVVILFLSEMQFKASALGTTCQCSSELSYFHKKRKNTFKKIYLIPIVTISVWATGACSKVVWYLASHWVVTPQSVWCQNFRSEQTRCWRITSWNTANGALISEKKVSVSVQQLWLMLVNKRMENIQQYWLMMGNGRSSS